MSVQSEINRITSAVADQAAKIDTLITKANSLPDAGSGGGSQWVEIGTSLQQEMYKLGDANMDGEITADDPPAIMGILSGETTETPLLFVLCDVDFDGALTFQDAMLTNEVINGSNELPFVYATAFEHENAKPGDYVHAVFAVSTSSGTVNVPTYAYVPKAGIIGIYSNVKIPLTAAGSIKLQKA